MADNEIRVLVVDDSAVLREQICDYISETPGMEVAGVARDGIEAIEKHAALCPDIVTLDVHMPRMDGFETLDAILKKNPTPVIMVSGLTTRSADATMQALDRGAMDYVPKPENLASGPEFREQLIRKLQTLARADVERVLRVRRNRNARSQQSRKSAGSSSAATGTEANVYAGKCIAIGISTGGPPALSELFQSLKPPLPPIVIVQHMPATFTGAFAARLDSLSPIHVKEAQTGDVLRPNHALLAPGGKHLHLRKNGANVSAWIRDGEPVSCHKPSVDVMMSDAAKLFSDRCFGIIMTGMGFDGVEGCAAIRKAGGMVFGQNESSSDVYGMNKAAFVAGHVNRQFDLEELPGLINQQCKKLFGKRPLSLAK